MSRSTIWVTLGVALLTSGCRGEYAHKRLPLGFQGMRGKKNVDLGGLDESVPLQNDADKTTYQHLPSFADLSTYSTIHDPWALARIRNNYYGIGSYKRAPMGFLGMRGKKEDDVDVSSLYPLLYDEYLNFEYPEKRALKGFQGMRGKKQFEYLRNKFFNKRKSMGFQGMRGKKDNVGEDHLMENIDLDELRNFLMENEGPYQTNDQNEDLFGGDQMYKRALKGFQGMRGKREFDDFNSLEEDKRAPSGFQGMRGKKDGNEQMTTNVSKETDVKPTSQNADAANGMQEVATNAIPSDSSERAALLDSFGIVDQDGGNDLLVSTKERRSPNYGFYGVRGKKLPSVSTFYGMRGKKGPYGFPFRGKFVGVRGKKSDNTQHLTDTLTWAGDDSYQKRRGPSGFLGMRGKKSITPEDEYEAFEDAK